MGGVPLVAGSGNHKSSPLAILLYMEAVKVVMEWIEVIQVRAFNENCKAKVIKQARGLSLAWKVKSLEAITVCIQPAPQTDVNIQLLWAKAANLKNCSWLGILLEDYFSELGWVNYNTWEVLEITEC